MPSAWLGRIGSTSSSDSTLPEKGDGAPEGGRADDTSVVAPSGSTNFDAVLTFSANFACRTEGCAPNILNAGYGANLLPVRLSG